MAYSGVGKPRFYIPLTELFYYNGAMSISSENVSDPNQVGYLNPSRKFEIIGDGLNDTLNFKFGTPVNDLIGDKGFVAILGHNFNTAGVKFLLQSIGGGLGESDWSGFTESEVINYPNQGNLIEQDGFTIITFDASSAADDQGGVGIRFDAFFGGAYPVTPTFGCAVMGTYFDMPVNPDLKLSMTRDYSGVKKTMTKSGATLSNAGYIRPADWNNGNAWELGGGYYANARTGRRTWALNYSFLSDHEVFSPNEIANTYIDPNAVGDYEDADVNTENTPYHNYNIGSDDSFYSRVINPSVGGHLPFIFNPVGADGDGQDNSPSNFAIARFDQKNFKFTQSMHKKYTFNTKIMESW